MEKIFNNAKECAEYLVEVCDERKYPNELRQLYYNSPVHYLHREMYDKYVRGKSVSAQNCEEFQKAKENAILFLEQELLKLSYNLSIKYTVICTYADGYCSDFKVDLESVYQQLTLFN
jgi:hypothetical protein